MRLIELTKQKAGKLVKINVSSEIEKREKVKEVLQTQSRMCEYLFLFDRPH
jgi:hypothetical protein